MKGKTLVIGLIVFVIVVVGLIYFLMMNTINGIKDEMDAEKEVSVIVEQTNLWGTNKYIL